MSSSDLRETALPRARSSPCVGLWFRSPRISPGVRGLLLARARASSWARLDSMPVTFAVARDCCPAAAARGLVTVVSDNGSPSYPGASVAALMPPRVGNRNAAPTPYSVRSGPTRTKRHRLCRGTPGRRRGAFGRLVKTRVEQGAAACASVRRSHAPSPRVPARLNAATHCCCVAGTKERVSVTHGPAHTEQH